MTTPSQSPGITFTDGIPRTALASYPDQPDELEINPRLAVLERTHVSHAYGLTDPSPGSARLLPIPKVMASPPTITPGAANAATAITNSVLYGPGGTTLDVFSFFGCTAPLGTTFPNTGFYSPWNAYSLGTIEVPGPFAVEFEFYGQQFELLLM